MLSKKMEEALNRQVNAELESFYIYLSMAAYFQSINLDGFASWMRAQAQEEMAHGLKIYDYVHEREGRVTLAKIGEPPKEWEKLEAAFRAAYDHEVEISRKIDKLVDLSIKESDHATHNFLQWFVSEQVEEIATVKGIIDKLRLLDNAPGGLFLLDREMGERGGSATQQ